MVRQVCLLSLWSLISLAIACTGGASAGATIREFDQYPLLWLGETYDAGNGTKPMALRRAAYEVSPAGRFHPELRSFGITYGNCEIKSPRTSCSIPIQIDFFGACDTPPLADEVKARTEPIRGVDAIIQTDKVIWIETGEFTVSVRTAFPVVEGQPLPNDEENSKKVVEALFGANDKAMHITKGTDFKVKSKDRAPCSASSAATPTPEPAASEAGPPYTILVDAIADGVVGGVQTNASFPNGSTQKIEVEALGVPNGIGGYSVVLGWDPAKLSVTAAQIVDKTGFTQVAKSVNAAAGTLTVGYYNGADITCTNPAAGGAAEGAASAVLFEVTFTGVAAGLTSLTFNPALTEMAVCDGAGGVSAPTVLQPAELTVTP